MNNNKPVILITGATGNTGSAVVRHMIRSAPKEYILRAASHDEAKLKRLFGKETKLELIRMDFKDKNSVRAALKVNQPKIPNQHKLTEISLEC
jgi:uncharacterized protein YbjT (DUF2867 family)